MISDTAGMDTADADTNETACGPHLPARRWDEAGFPGRTPRTHKGRKDADGVWGPDTRAVDHLIGRWDDGHGGQVEGSGFHAIAELAYQLGTPAEVAFRATVNDGIDPGGGGLYDWALVNDAIRGCVVKDSYRIAVPPATTRDRLPCDHRRETVAANAPPVATIAAVHVVLACTLCPPLARRAVAWGLFERGRLVRR
jgi:hypothetical protein